MKFFLFIAFCLLINLNLEAQGWLNRSTSFSDTFIDIRYYKGKGIIIGHQGIYINSVSIDSSTKWNKLNYSGSTQNTTIFNATKFTQIHLDQHRGIVYISGYETTTNKGVIFKYNLDSLNYSLYYVGSPGKKITGIIVKDHTASFLGYLYAVGDSGMVINFDLTAGTNSIDYHGNHNFKGILDKFSGSAWEKIILYTEDKLFNGLNFPLQITGNYTLGSNIQHYIYSSTFSAGGFMIHNNKLSKSLFFTAPMSLFQTNMNRSNDSTLILHRVSYNPTSIFVATNKGIYKAFSDVAYEYQSTSGVNDFRNLWFIVDTGYAVGTGGKVYYTRNAGGLVVPYREHKTQTKCVNESFQLDGRTTSTSYNCSFIMDAAVTINPSCKTFNFTFPNPTYTFTSVGNHTVNYKVTNASGDFLDATKTFYIPSVPTVNMPFSVNDTILCKAEKVLYTVTNTIANFEYHVIEQATGKSFGYGVGNGGTMSFWTDTIRNQGYYFIRVQYPNTNCFRDFTNKTFIKVEKTQAIFKASKINMRTNEELILFDKSKDANTYNWSFFGGASIPNSTLREPTITYTSSGKKSARLIVTSPNNCKDTLDKDIVYVYSKSGSDDACFTIPYPNANPSYHYSTPIKEKILFFNDEKSYIMSHYGDSIIYKSRYGDSIKSSDIRQSSLNLYTPDGALKWQIKVNCGITLNDFSIDKNTNDVYFTGTSSDPYYTNYPSYCSTINPYVILNNGDTVYLSHAYPSSFLYPSSQTSFIMKVDSNGKYKWHSMLMGLNQNFSSYNHVSIGRLEVNKGNLYISGIRASQLAIFRDKVVDTIVNNPTTNVNFFMKMDTAGKRIWTTESYVSFHDIAIDKEKNIHLIYSYGGNGTFYIKDIKNDSFSVFKSTVAATNNSSGYFSMDSNGNYRNHFYSRCIGFSGGNSYKNLVLDAKDDIYISSTTEFDSSAIIYSDGSMDEFQLKNALLLKFKNKGKLSWAVGVESSYYGESSSVFLKNNKLYLLGSAGLNNTDSIYNFKFVSKGGNSIYRKMNAYNFFIAEYDTSGFLFYVKRATQPSNIFDKSVFTLYQIILDKNDNKFISGYRWLFNESPLTQNIFNVPLTTYSKVVFYAKFNEKLCDNSSPPTANAGIDKYICKGDSIQIGNMGAAHLRYFWRSEPAQLNKYIANPFVSPFKTSKYILTVVDSNGLYAYDTMMVYVKGDSISAGNDTTICKLDSVLIGSSALSGATYQWTSSPTGINQTTSQLFVKPNLTSLYFLVANYQGCVIKDTIEVKVETRVNAGVSISKNKSIVCANDTILFSPVLDSCGSNSKYFWKKNSIDVSTDSILKLDKLLNFDSIHLMIIPSNKCVLSSPLYSNKIGISVNDTFNPTCNILLDKSNYCAGDTVKCIARFQNSGKQPMFSWYRNNVLIKKSQDTLFQTVAQKNDTIYCKVVSSNLCSKDSQAISNTLYPFVNNLDTAKLFITTATNPYCVGATVLFKSTLINGGVSPKYQWVKNSVLILGATDSILSSNTFSNNDTISCRVISKKVCLIDSFAFSNKIKLTELSKIAPSISVSTLKDTICIGNSITLNSNIINGGLTPQYQWYKNGILISGANSANFSSSIISSGDIFTCKLTSSHSCANPSDTLSNQLKITVVNSITPSVYISTPKNSICVGSTALFSSIITNGGSSPIFEWRKNNSIVSSNANYSTSSIQNNDTIYSYLTSSYPCASPKKVLSNKIIMKVSPIMAPTITIVNNNPTLIAPNIFVVSSISNLGTNASYQWQDSTLTRSWQNIFGAKNSSINYSTLAGHKLRCILTSKDSCASPLTVTSNVLTFNGKSSINDGLNSDIFVYPNPTKNKLTLSGLSLDENWATASITDIAGRTVIKNISIKNQSEVTIDLGNIDVGSYVLTITSKDNLVKSFNFIKE